MRLTQDIHEARELAQKWKEAPQSMSTEDLENLLRWVWRRMQVTEMRLDDEGFVEVTESRNNILLREVEEDLQTPSGSLCDLAEDFTLFTQKFLEMAHDRNIERWRRIKTERECEILQDVLRSSTKT